MTDPKLQQEMQHAIQAMEKRSAKAIKGMMQ